MISIIIPVFNEAEQIVARLQALQSLRERGCELLVVDGGSSDNSFELAVPWADKVLLAGLGRAKQMNLGAQHASQKLLLFLHLDTQMPADFGDQIETLLAAQWGFFPVCFDSRSPAMALIAMLMNVRSRLSRVATGDQAIFIAAKLFSHLGGYANIPLMEDVEMCKRLRKQQRPKLMRQKVQTSARRWQQRGLLKTVLNMWYLRLLYFFGASPESLAASYYPNFKFAKAKSGYDKS